MSFASAKPSSAPDASAQKPISPESYQFLQQWIYRESGIVIDQDKSYLLTRGLARSLNGSPCRPWICSAANYVPMRRGSRGRSLMR
jgi:hypothetical protein